MKKVYIETIAPILRGLTFDNEKGNIIVFRDVYKKAFFSIFTESYNLISRQLISKRAIKNITIPLYLDLIQKSNLLDEKQLRKKIIASTIRKFNIYEKKYNQNPNTVILENIGIFYMGKSYDEANSIKSVFKENLKSMKTKPKFSKSHSSYEDVKKLEGGEDSALSLDLEKNHNDGKVDRNDIVKNKIAVVTGGAQGFGESIVRELTKSGSLVFIADINIEGARKLADELNTQYKKTTALPVKVDVTDEASVEGMIYEVVKEAGGIDIFISNAGVLNAQSVKEMKLNTFKFVTDVNYIGYFLCVKHASKIMALQNIPAKKYFTDIIQINSKSGTRGSNKNSAYAGSKFGGIGLTQSFALELIEDNIKVNSVCPGNFFEGPLWSDPEKGLFIQYLRNKKVPGAKTIEDVKRFYESKIPIKRGCTGKDLIKAIYYIIDQKYETGQAIPVTGGQIMLK